MLEDMKKLLSKQLIIILLIIAILLGIIGINYSLSPLEVIFLDVGQGDATFIKAPDGRTILIDGGPDNSILRGLGKNMPFYRRSLDFVIISHYHDDHIIGLIEIIKRYQVKNLIYSGKKIDSANMSELLRMAAIYNVEVIKIDSELEIEFEENCFLKLLNPGILKIKDDPNNSISSKFECRSLDFFLAGDNGLAAEAALMDRGWISDADVFKASHHGSNSSNGSVFMERMSPGLIVVSVGKDNRFGHPGDKFLERTESLDIPVKRTDIDGSVKVLVK